ncbi:hypothetical protein LRP49_08060 [Enterovibrio sp. ZSDZ35]|uniref:Uncharacterized protein n=1 Tax=Enterovibrio qingdaonensis TaxID=2899818 RepID=A0ABT5QKH0_9GAMM|nr:hypothetical protein [Enterovibrio sp. ZSDZ35]MDD1781158.1 hypothetical protein [Enterovibrio sp. ZSDZ35]
MSLKGLQKYLALNHIDYEEITDGLMIKLGFLVGRVHVKWDDRKDTFNFNDKSRWVTQAFVVILMLYFLLTNLGIYSSLQLYTCVGVTLAMLGIFSYKEFKIHQIKAAILKNVLAK